MKAEKFHLYMFKNELYAINKISSVECLGIHLTGPNPDVMHAFWQMESDYPAADWIYSYNRSVLGKRLKASELDRDLLYIGEKALEYTTIRLYDSNDKYLRSILAHEV